LICLDKNFTTIDNHSLYALSDLMKECIDLIVLYKFDIDIKEVSKEISSYSELNGRSDSNLIDALNGAYNYQMTK
jgi:hypothetical protein